MKFTWKGKWRKGEIIIEAETFQELNTALKELLSAAKIADVSGEANDTFPETHHVSGCADAIRALMKTEWGKQGRSMRDIRKALEVNALYFSKGALSGTLTTLAKRGDLRRVKKGGKWKYYTKETG